MKTRSAARWRRAQVERLGPSASNRELLDLLWSWREELGIGESLLREHVGDRLRLAIYGMNSEEHGFVLHPAVERHYRELRTCYFGAPFISHRDLCLLYMLPFGTRAYELFGGDVARFNMSLFFEASTLLAILDHWSVVARNRIEVDVSAADWLDMERAYEQPQGIKWANEYLYKKGVLAAPVSARGRPRKDAADPPRPFIVPPDPTDFTPRVVPTYNDHWIYKTVIDVTGSSLSQLKAYWPQVRVHRYFRYDGFDASRPQHRPRSQLSLQDKASLMISYDHAEIKHDWLQNVADERCVEADSLLRTIRRAKAHFNDPEK